MTKPAEKPILFSTPLVRAILDGKKTETRRVVKFLPGKEQPAYAHGGPNPPYVCDRLEECMWCGFALAWCSTEGGCTCVPAARRSPFGSPGDLLWVRETWRYADWTEDGEPFVAHRAGDMPPRLFLPGIEYTDRLVDVWAALSEPKNTAIDGLAADRSWRPSIHMPKWAARIWLRVEEVRVERLRDITEEEARAEGVTPSTTKGASDAWGGPHRWAFMRLWADIYGDDHITAGANPWVWVVRFEVVSTTGRPE